MIVMGYSFKVHYSEEDDGWVVVFPDLPGCTAHGESWGKAVEEAKTALLLWLATAVEDVEVERGLPLPEWLCDA